MRTEGEAKQQRRHLYQHQHRHHPTVRGLQRWWLGRPRRGGKASGRFLVLGCFLLGLVARVELQGCWVGVGAEAAHATVVTPEDSGRLDSSSDSGRRASSSSSASSTSSASSSSSVAASIDATGQTTIPQPVAGEEEDPLDWDALHPEDDSPELWERYHCHLYFGDDDENEVETNNNSSTNQPSSPPPRPVPTREEWAYLRGTYVAVVGVEHSSIPPHQAIQQRNGFAVPIEVRVNDLVGRAVYATTNIRRGDLVWSHGLTAEFDSGHDYQRFLESLPEELACDVLIWAYVQDVGNEVRRHNHRAQCGAANHTYIVAVDLDEGSLINSDAKAKNIGCIPKSERTTSESIGLSCKGYLFALRDIRAGEEILIDYADHYVNNAWKVFGL